jgi:hypothetical protein
LLILIILFYLLILIIKMEMELEMNTYYILITSLDVYQDKLNTMLKLLSHQIDHYNYKKQHKQPIKIIVCTVTIDRHVKRKFLLKEINNSIYYTFLDVTDDIDTMYIINFIDSMHITRHIATQNVVVTACNSKYFRSCLTLITPLYTYSDSCIDTIYVFDLGLTNEEQQLLST